MMQPRRLEFVGAEGNRLVADLWDGRGHPVLFLHGGGQTRRAWDKTAQRVAAEGMRAITVDQRGHGESEWVPSGNYTFAHYAEDAAAVIRQVADTFHAAPSAVGASLGGLAALAAETRLGRMLESLILVDVTPRMDPVGVSKIQGFMAKDSKTGSPPLTKLPMRSPATCRTASGLPLSTVWPRICAWERTGAIAGIGIQPS